MINNSALNIFRRYFGKALVLTLLLGVTSVASYAQSGNLYYQSNGTYYGRVTVIPGSHFEIYTNDGRVIKTFRNSCRNVNNGVAGVLCTFGQFKDGRHVYSGQAYFFQNGFVYLRWTNENIVGNQWRQIDTGWYGFRP